MTPRHDIEKKFQSACNTSNGTTVSSWTILSPTHSKEVSSKAYLPAYLSGPAPSIQPRGIKATRLGPSAASDQLLGHKEDTTLTSVLQAEDSGPLSEASQHWSVEKAGRS